MNQDRLRQVLVVSGVVGTLTVNALSQIIPFNGQTSAEIANRIPIFFLPANYVFSIWSLIYIGLFAYAIFQALPAQRENPRLRAIGGWFILSCVANCTWLFLFHYNQFWVSTVAMVVLLVSLIVIYRLLRAGSPSIGAGERWAVRLPFSIYLGWITVATVANFTYALYSPNSSLLGIPDATWGAIMLLVAAGIGGAFAFLNRDAVYALVLVWSFVGIIVRFPAEGAVTIAAGVAAAALAVAAVIVLLQRRGDSATLTPRRA